MSGKMKQKSNPLLNPCSLGLPSLCAVVSSYRGDKGFYEIYHTRHGCNCDVGTRRVVMSVD
jgi:hypothetical protein